MIEVEIHIPTSIKPEAVITGVEQICDDYNLLCSLKGSLAAYPECIHWHFKKTRQSGILEITWWEKEHRLWFKMSDHRTGIWNGEILPILKNKIEQRLHEI